jgi:SAM-dependent methyltransferase
MRLRGALAGLLICALLLAIGAIAAPRGTQEPTQPATQEPGTPGDTIPGDTIPGVTIPRDSSTTTSTDSGSSAEPGTYEPQEGQEGKDVVWVPTNDALVDMMLDIAEVRPTDFVIDLGSGDGRTVIAAAQRGARALGVEYNPDMVELSRRRAFEAGVAHKVFFDNGDLFETDLSRASVITMFLLPEINMRLRPRLLDLEPGTRIVSNSFSMEDWEADERQSIGEEEGCESWCTALLWIVPAKVAGTWRLGGEDLRLEQQFQTVSGTLGKRRVRDGRLRGTEISFAIGGRRYSGHVNGHTMDGTIGGPAGPTWKATRADVPATAP